MDLDIRALELELRRDPNEKNELAWIRARLRAGDLRPSVLPIAATLGSAAARSLLPRTYRVRVFAPDVPLEESEWRDATRWCHYVRSAGRVAAVLAATRLVRLVARGPEKARIQSLLLAFERWLRERSLEAVVAVESAWYPELLRGPTDADEMHALPSREVVILQAIATVRALRFDEALEKAIFAAKEVVPEEDCAAVVRAALIEGVLRGRELLR